MTFKPSVLEKKVYNNDNKTFFSILKFAKPECDSVLQPELQSGVGCNTLSHSGLANFIIWKIMFYPLIHSVSENKC